MADRHEQVVHFSVSNGTFLWSHRQTSKILDVCFHTHREKWAYLLRSSSASDRRVAASSEGGAELRDTGTAHGWAGGMDTDRQEDQWESRNEVIGRIQGQWDGERWREIWEKKKKKDKMQRLLVNRNVYRINIMTQWKGIYCMINTHVYWDNV